MSVTTGVPWNDVLRKRLADPDEAVKMYKASLNLYNEVEDKLATLQAKNERLKDEIHEWEESDAAAEILGPTFAEITAENERLNQRVEDIESINHTLACEITSVRADERKRVAGEILKMVDDNRPSDTWAPGYEGELATCDLIADAIRAKYGVEN